MVTKYLRDGTLLLKVISAVSSFFGETIEKVQCCSIRIHLDLRCFGSVEWSVPLCWAQKRPRPRSAARKFFDQWNATL
ncbi:hypothetical protein [Rubritalea tangerina]|uniref:hypothetical protein n=1 Tax=Rubritalea tangerina TaxID=430798 RepID=UPI00361136CB